MRTIGKYEIRERVGSGGFGVVYRAWDPFIGREVAIKTLLTDDEDMRQRFSREARLAGNLHHPNITTIYDFGVHEGMLFLVQEYLSGEDLAATIERRQPVPLGDKLRWLADIASGLAAAHDHGVVHRDIKPANIRILAGGEAKIMDFGIAKPLQAVTRLTRSGLTIGTAAYLAPEQVTGAAATPQSDIFSFGLVMYELLGYVRAIPGPEIWDAMRQIVHEPHRPLASHWPQCPTALTAIVDRCLAKVPDERFADSRQLARALEAEYQPLRLALLRAAPGAAAGGATVSASRLMTELWPPGGHPAAGAPEPAPAGPAALAPPPLPIATAAPTRGQVPAPTTAPTRAPAPIPEGAPMPTVAPIPTPVSVTSVAPAPTAVSGATTAAAPPLPPAAPKAPMAASPVSSPPTASPEPPAVARTTPWAGRAAAPSAVAAFDLDAVDLHAGGSLLAEARGVAEPTGERRPRAPVAVVAALLLLGSLAVAAWWLGWLGVPPPPAIAERGAPVADDVSSGVAVGEEAAAAPAVLPIPPAGAAPAPAAPGPAAASPAAAGLAAAVPVDPGPASPVKATLASAPSLPAVPDDRFPVEPVAPPAPGRPPAGASPSAVTLEAGWSDRITVAIDGGRAQPLRAARLELPAGRHRFVFELSGSAYHTREAVDLELDPGATITLAPTIERPTLLRVQAAIGTPQGVVRVDGQDLGRSPQTRWVAPGAYPVSLGDGDRAVSAEVTVGADQVVLVTLDGTAATAPRVVSRQRDARDPSWDDADADADMDVIVIDP